MRLPTWVYARSAKSVGAVREGRLLCELEVIKCGGGVVRGVDRADLRFL